MMNDRVNLTCQPIRVGDDDQVKIQLDVNGEWMGDYYAKPGESLVEHGLLLIGFASVEVSGVGLSRSQVSLQDLTSHLTQQGLAHSPQVRGERGAVALRRFRPDCFDESFFEVSVDGTVFWDWIPGKSDLATLQAVLRTLSFDVEVAHLSPPESQVETLKVA